MQIKRFRDTDSTWLIRPKFEAHFINLYHGLEHQNKSLQSSARKSGSLKGSTKTWNPESGNGNGIPETETETETETEYGIKYQ